MSPPFLVAIVVFLLVTSASVLVVDSSLAVPGQSPAPGQAVAGDTAVGAGTVGLDAALGVPSRSVPTPVDSCRVIDRPGEYVLTRDVVSDPSGTPADFACLRVVVDDPDATVRIDGDGHALRSSDRSDTAVSVGEDGTTVVTDLTVSGWAQAFEADEKQGARLGGVDALELSNVVATDNGVVVVADGARRVVVTDSAFSNNGAGVLTEETVVEFVGLSVTDSDRSGVEMAQTSGTVVDSDFSRNGANGVGFVISGSFEFRNVVAADNGRHGMSAGVSDTVTVVDSDFSGNARSGIVVSDMLWSRFASNHVADNEVGIWLRTGSTDVTLVGNRVVDNADAGLVVGERFGQTVVFDNRLSNRQNVVFDPSYDPVVDPGDPIDPALEIAWNVDPRPELNVVEGAFVGGNYYASPDGDGFSETCADADVDTLCDAPLELFEGNVDQHPLAVPHVPADEPPTAVAPADLRDATFAVDCGVLTGGRSVEFGYGVLGDAGIPSDAASREWTNEDVLDTVLDSPLGPAVRHLGVDAADLFWTANPDDQVVRVFADTPVGVRSCTCTVVD